MPNPKIIYPVNYTPAQALAFANADNTAATVSASAPLPVTHGDGAMVSLGAMADAAALSSGQGQDHRVPPALASGVFQTSRRKVVAEGCG